MDDDGLKILLERMREDGIATCMVKDGRILAINRKKLRELTMIMDCEDKDEIIIFIKGAETLN